MEKVRIADLTHPRDLDALVGMLMVHDAQGSEWRHNLRASGVVVGTVYGKGTFMGRGTIAYAEQPEWLQKKVVEMAIDAFGQEIDVAELKQEQWQ